MKLFLILVLIAGVGRAFCSVPFYGMSVPFGNTTSQVGYIPFPETMQVYGDKRPTILEGPASYYAAFDGSVYFLDTAQVSVKQYDSLGRFVRSIPYPVITEKKEYQYTSIYVAPRGDIWLLDSQSNFLVCLDGKTGKPIFEKLIRLPEKIGKMRFFPVDFRVVGSTALLRDAQTNGVYAWINGEQKGLKTLLKSNFSQTTLFVDSHKRIICFQADKKEPERIHFYAAHPGKNPEELFVTEKLNELAMIRLFGCIQDHLLLAVYSGGELQMSLKEIRIYSLNGTLVRTLPVNIDELPWDSSGAQCFSNGKDVYIMKYKSTSNSLFLYRVPFEKLLLKKKFQ